MPFVNNIVYFFHSKKKSKKRKFSASNDSEFIDNAPSKKFKESSEGEVTKFTENKKQKKFKKQKDFQRKNSNDLKFKDDLFSKKLKGSYQQEDSKNNEDKKFKTQQDFPRKNKQSKANSFNSTAVFPKFEAGDDSENEMESPSVPKLSNVSKDTKQVKSFIKKSKKKSLDQNSSCELPKVTSCNDSDVSDDVSLKNEIKEFMHSNSEKKKTKKNCDNEEKTWYVQDTIEKTKKKFSTNESNSPEKRETSEQNIKSKKKNKNKNFDHQDFPRTNKESKDNSFNSNNTESVVKDYGFNQNTLSTELNLEHNDVKKPKKSKHGLNVVNASDSLTPEKNSETTNHKDKGMTDFIRKPKNKIVDDTFGKGSFKKSNIKAFDNGNIGNSPKGEEFNAKSMQNPQVKGFGSEAPDFIKLSTSDDDNEKNSEERLSRTLFVGNLPKNMSKQVSMHDKLLHGNFIYFLF